MKSVSMSGSLRENVGKKDAKKNRAEGKVPCVLYGGKEEVHFAVNEKDFGPVIFTRMHTLSILPFRVRNTRPSSRMFNTIR
jgi:ribosomal protein L25 (general stress protein Ctc)